MRNSVIYLLVAVALLSCSKEPPITDGDSWGEKPQTVLSIASLKEKYLGTPLLIEGDVYIEGRIVSTDMWGNCRNTIYVEDESGGICIWAAITDYFLEFQREMKIKLDCNSLVLTDYGGMVRIAMYRADDYYEITPLTLERLRASSTLYPPQGSIKAPPILTITGIEKKYLGRMIALRNVQFAREEIGLTWCDEDTDTDRTLIDASGNRLVVRTSRHADFAHRTLPRGSGYLEGILTQFNGTYQLVVSNIQNVIMDKPPL